MTRKDYELIAGAFADTKPRDADPVIDADALRQAKRSTDVASMERLEVWNGTEYVPVLEPTP